jgi:hypothetical protein
VTVPGAAPLSTLLSQVLIAHTIELDNEFERRFAEAGGGARVVSVVMWSNFLRFVGDGTTVDELPTASGLPKPRTLSTLGGMERWRYIAVGPAAVDKRDGWGSARGLRGDWVVRPTSAGRAAAEIWRPLFDDIEQRWEERFGAETIDELRRSLAAIVRRVDVELPELVPIVDGKDGMAAGLGPPEQRDRTASDGKLMVLLSRALLAYTIDFEGESELSLPLSANFVRVLDETGVAVRDLPLAASVPKEATSMALTYLTKNGYVAVHEKVARLTPKGREAHDRLRRLHAAVEKRWVARFGADHVDRLRLALQRVRDDPCLSNALEPHPDGWRSTKRYSAHTKAMLDDPRRGLPHYPVVLHRGGWPDGS